MNKRFLVTAENLSHGIAIQASDAAMAIYKVGRLQAQHSGKELVNPKAEPIPTEAEKDARIAELEAALRELLKQTIGDTDPVFEPRPEYLEAREKAHAALRGK